MKGVMRWYPGALSTTKNQNGRTNMLPTNELQNPFYTTFGTCFAANILVGETMAHSVRYLRLLLHQPKEDVPKFKV